VRVYEGIEGEDEVIYRIGQCRVKRVGPGKHASGLRICDQVLPPDTANADQDIHS
jgi:hypothetical protein